MEKTVIKGGISKGKFKKTKSTLGLLLLTIFSYHQQVILIKSAQDQQRNNDDLKNS